MPYSTETGQKNVLHWRDYVIFAGSLLLSASVGLYHAIKGRKTNSAKDFHMGNRQMHTVPVALSVSVTFLSALTLLGQPVEVYVYDTMFWWLVLSLVFASAGAAHIFIPVFYKLGLMSAFQYFELRFGNLVRILASVNWIVQTLLYQAFVLFAPSLALNAVTGLDLWFSISTVGFIVTLYTTLGGMKTVLWTDSLQSLIIMVGLISLLVMGTQAVGGFSTAWEIANNHERLRFFDFSPNPGVRHSFWSVVVGGSIVWVSKLGVHQSQVQRLLSCPSLKKAQVALWLAAFGMVTIIMVCNIIGILIHAFYKDCNPMDFEGLISSYDQLVPLFAMDLFHNTSCLPGIFLACVFSGSLSTLSSALNALSVVVLEDYVMVYCCPSMSETRAIIISRSLVILFGALSMAVAYVISNIGNILQVCYTVQSIMDGPLLGLFVLGMFCPRANTVGAAIGYTISSAFMLWIGIGAYVNGVKTPTSTTYTHGCNWNISTSNYSVFDVNISNFNTSSMTPEDVSSEKKYLSLYEMSYLYYTATGMGVTVVVGVIVSYIARVFVESQPVSKKLSRSPLDIISSWIHTKQQEPEQDLEHYTEDGDQTLVDSPFVQGGHITTTFVHGNSPSQMWASVNIEEPA